MLRDELNFGELRHNGARWVGGPGEDDGYVARCLERSELIQGNGVGRRGPPSVRVLTLKARRSSGHVHSWTRETGAEDDPVG
jgi:hypothetical protein